MLLASGKARKLPTACLSLWAIHFAFAILPCLASESISLQVVEPEGLETDARFQAYLQGLRERLLENWYPENEGTVVLDIVIDNAGKDQKAGFHGESALLTQTAIKALEFSKPLPQLPGNLGSLDLRAIFRSDGATSRRRLRPSADSQNSGGKLSLVGLDQGRMSLDDGSVWEMSPTYVADAFGWRQYDTIKLLPTNLEHYPYAALNERTGESVPVSPSRSNISSGFRWKKLFGFEDKNNQPSMQPSIEMNPVNPFQPNYANPSVVPVRGYFRSNGTFVQPHIRTRANSSKMDNFNSRGNWNPYTGKPGYR